MRILSATIATGIVLLGPVKSPTGERVIDCESAFGWTVRTALVEGAGFSENDLRHLVVVRDGKRLGPNDAVGAGAVLEVMLPAGGG